MEEDHEFIYDETFKCDHCKQYKHLSLVDDCDCCELVICNECFDEHINGKNYAFKAGE